MLFTSSSLSSSLLEAEVVCFKSSDLNCGDLPMGGEPNPASCCGDKQGGSYFDTASFKCVTCGETIGRLALQSVVCVHACVCVP